MRALRPVMSVLVALALIGGGPARADSVSGAQERASQERDYEEKASEARAEVAALLDRYRQANVGVDQGVAALSRAFALASTAEVTRDEARGQAERALAAQAQQVRAVYADGGPSSVIASLLTADDPDDALWRASTADRVITTLLADSRTATEQAQATAVLARRRAQLTAEATQAQGTALQQLQARAGAAGAALEQAERTLTDLDAQARRARAARSAARQIAAAEEAARAARQVAMGPVTALGIPAEYETAYRAAARTCPGMPWTLLAGVGQVESGHGRNNGPSSAGAIGPMQFLPATFRAYAVDGDHDGVLDPWDPQDAAFTAAHYLCASGAIGGSAAGIHAALLTYNHAEWYVDLVLAAEQAIITQAAGPR